MFRLASRWRRSHSCSESSCDSPGWTIVRVGDTDVRRGIDNPTSMSDLLRMEMVSLPYWSLRTGNLLAFRNRVLSVKWQHETQRVPLHFSVLLPISLTISICTLFCATFCFSLHLDRDLHTHLFLFLCQDLDLCLFLWLLLSLSLFVLVLSFPYSLSLSLSFRFALLFFSCLVSIPFFLSVPVRVPRFVSLPPHVGDLVVDRPREATFRTNLFFSIVLKSQFRLLTQIQKTAVFQYKPFWVIFNSDVI